MPQLTLPPSVATKAQLMSLRKNIEEVLESVTQNNVRLRENVDAKPAPAVSGSLANILKLNNLEVNLETIAELSKWVEYLLHHAPIVRITFASEPSAKELSQLIEWFRQETGLIVLMHIGLQPTIAGGMIVRTTSHRYDLSLRKDLLSQTDTFIASINKVVGNIEPEAPAEPPAQELAEQETVAVAEAE